jgi:glycosyltransferase involved in cell wall biosynthesis
MRIGIDGRLWFETGVGRYIRNLVRELARIDRKNTYILYLTKKGYDAFVPPNERWQKRIADVRWHTVREQIVLPILFWRDHVDVLHIPYFSAPIFYPGRFVETVHDLTNLHVRTGRASTLPSWLYEIKRFAYSIIFSVGIHRAKKIFAVSKTTKNDIISNYHINEHKIIVTYEGVENPPVPPVKTPPIDGKYFLYVGNAYPHKNLENLLAAFDRVKKNGSNPEIKLILVGKGDHFTERLKEFAHTFASHESIIFFGEATEAELFAIYTHANAFVFPSFIEGFGLPAIEAVACGCPVVCSDIPIFHEILGNKAVYFNPHDISDMSLGIQRALLMTKKPAPFIDKRFSWSEMAKETLQGYEDSIRI